MSLVRKSSKATLRTTADDFSTAMDQKNNIIYSLQTELQNLRPNHQKFMRIKQELLRAKAKQEGLIKDYERVVSNNADRLDLSARNVQQLRIQVQLNSQELRLRVQALKESKFCTQQLLELQNRKQDESTQCKIKFQEQKNNSEVLKMEEERIRIQICQVREQVEKTKKQNYSIRTQSQDLNQKCYKTQSYNRGLSRQEANLNESLCKIEDENQKLEVGICQLSAVIGVNESGISEKEKGIGEMSVSLANKHLEKKKMENEIKQKIRQLSVEKQKSRALLEQIEYKKSDSSKLESHLAEVCAEINFIYGKNHQIEEVNQHLRQDLKVCERHRENVLRNTKVLDLEIEVYRDQSLKAICKLEQPLKHRSGLSEAGSQWKMNSSRVTELEAGELERRTLRT